MPDEPLDDLPPDPFDEGLKKLQEKADALKAPELPAEVQGDFDSRMEELEARAQAVKREREAKEAQAARATKSDRDAAKGLGVGMSIAYTIIGLPLFGALVGWMIDNNTGGTQAKGIGVMIGVVAGMGMAFVILNRHQDK